MTLISGKYTRPLVFYCSLPQIFSFGLIRISYISITMRGPFHIFLISPDAHFEDEAKIVARLFGLGLETYHLRKPSFTEDELRSFLIALPPEFHNRIVIHSHFELSLEFDLKGIHLNEANKERIGHLSHYKVISGSFHSLPDLKENTVPYQYVFLSPVFDSISKAGYASNFDLAQLAAELSLPSAKLLPEIIALGGINAENLPLIRQTGFAGVAVLGAVWLQQDPVQEFLYLQALAGQNG